MGDRSGTAVPPLERRRRVGGGTQPRPTEAEGRGRTAHPIAYRRRVEADRIAHAHPFDRRPHIAECTSKPGAKECADVRVEVCQQSKTILALPECADVKKSLDDAAGVEITS